MLKKKLALLACIVILVAFAGVSTVSAGERRG